MCDRIAKSNQLGSLGLRNVRPFVLGKHGEKEDRYLVMSIKVQDAIAAALSAPGARNPDLPQAPPRATPHSGSSASSDTTDMRSSSLMPTAAARRRNSGVSTTVWRRFGKTIYTPLTHMSMTHPFRTVSPNNIGFFAAVRFAGRRGVTSETEGGFLRSDRFDRGGERLRSGRCGGRRA